MDLLEDEWAKLANSDCLVDPAWQRSNGSTLAKPAPALEDSATSMGSAVASEPWLTLEVIWMNAPEKGVV